MKRWLPRFRRSGWTGCYAHGEVEGWSLEIDWLGFHVEFVIAREEGR